jgi:hypothetical protein
VLLVLWQQQVLQRLANLEQIVEQMSQLVRPFRHQHSWQQL